MQEILDTELVQKLIEIFADIDFLTISDMFDILKEPLEFEIEYAKLMKYVKNGKVECHNNLTNLNVIDEKEDEFSFTIDDLDLDIDFGDSTEDASQKEKN